MEERLILVDEQDREIGSEEKLLAHQKGLLHRAFSVFVFSSKGELMLQKRAQGKYHSEGLWTNTACGHPRPGEAVRDAAERRLREEMRISVPLSEMFLFSYTTSFANGLTENEIDHVMFGEFDDDPTPNPLEASDWQWITLETLEKEIADQPEQYTFWLQSCFNKIKGHWPQSRS